MIRSAKQALAHYHYCFVRHMYSKRLADDEQLLQMIGDGVTDIARKHMDTNEARIQIRDLKRRVKVVCEQRGIWHKEAFNHICYRYKRELTHQTQTRARGAMGADGSAVDSSADA